MLVLEDVAPCEQALIEGEPYDRWLTPQGGVSAEFFRKESEFCVRFPNQADFLIDEAVERVKCRPVPNLPAFIAESLYYNSIVPLIANHLGALNLHASAVSLGDQAVAFSGVSGKGKTTIATAFATHGYAFLAEDILDLRRIDSRYLVQPTRPVLRLFDDSASALVGGSTHVEGEEVGSKRLVHASECVPFQEEAVPLSAIFFLGRNEVDRAEIHRLTSAKALAELCQHTFILDVEDKPRLRNHFSQLASLANCIPCFVLDYPRRYDQLREVIALTIDSLRKARSGEPD